MSNKQQFRCFYRLGIITEADLNNKRLILNPDGYILFNWKEALVPSQSTFYYTQHFSPE